MASEKPTSPESSVQPAQPARSAEPAPSAPPVAAKARKSGIPGWVTIGAVIFVLIAAAGLAFSYHIGLLTHNFRTIAPQCYRSAQLSPELLEQHIKDQQLKCVLNLRGDHGNAEWHKGELDVCTRLSVEHADIAFDLRKLPDPDALKELVDRFEKGPYPMLMHCRAGSERTGMAAALYCMLVEHKTLEEALATQTGWHVGHFRNTSNDAGDRFFEIYKATSNGQNIKDWILESYPAIFKKIGTHGCVADIKG
jgi:protein tyrosine phosphatase (PTP) superfamily phosphohydrolase (DUF442 family)